MPQMDWILADSDSAFAASRPASNHFVASSNLAGRHRLQSDFYSVKYVQRGQETYHGQFGKTVLSGDRLLIVAPNAPIEVDISAGAQGICAYLDKSDIIDFVAASVEDEEELTVLQSPSFAQVLPVEATPLGVFMANIEPVRDDIDGDVFSSLAGEEMVRFLSRSRRLPNKKTRTRCDIYARVMAAKRVMDQNIDHPMSLDEMSAIACMSSYHFVRSFTLVFEETPVRYRQNCLLERSRRDILAGETVERAGARAGFSSVSAFSRAFKRRFGTAPSHLLK